MKCSKKFIIETVGSDRPDTLYAMSNFAKSQLERFTTPEQNKQRAGAYGLLKKCHNIYVNTLGRTHPDTLKCLNGLAIVLAGENKYVEISDYMEEFMNIEPEVLDRSNVGLIADLFQRNRQHASAIRMLESVVLERAHVIGEDHPDTVMSQMALAEIYHDDLQFAKVVPLLEKVLDWLSNKDLLYSSKGLNALGKQADCYFKLHRLDEAYELNEKILVHRKKHLGQTHSGLKNVIEAQQSIIRMEKIQNEKKGK